MDEQTWQDIEAEVKRDLAAIETDKQANDFIAKYISKERQADAYRFYRSWRHEMLKTPREAIDYLLTLPEW